MILAACAFIVHSYAPHCGASGRTATGTTPVARRTAAADWSILPPGTWIHISGLGPFLIEDNGPAIVGRVIDVYAPTCRAADAWGDRRRSVVVLPRPMSATEYDELVGQVAEVRASLKAGAAPRAPPSPATSTPGSPSELAAGFYLDPLAIAQALVASLSTGLACVSALFWLLLRPMTREIRQ